MSSLKLIPSGATADRPGSPEQKTTDPPGWQENVGFSKCSGDGKSSASIDRAAPGLAAQTSPGQQLRIGAVLDGEDPPGRSTASSSGRRRVQLAQALLEEIEVDRLGEEIGGADFGGAAAPFVVAVGGHHHHRQLGPPRPDLAQQR